MPPQHGARAHYEMHVFEHLSRDAVQRLGKHGPITRVEPYPLPAELALQHGELMAQRQDLRVLGVIAH